MSDRLSTIERWLAGARGRLMALLRAFVGLSGWLVAVLVAVVLLPLGWLLESDKQGTGGERTEPSSTHRVRSSPHSAGATPDGDTVADGTSDNERLSLEFAAIAHEARSDEDPRRDHSGQPGNEPTGRSSASSLDTVHERISPAGWLTADVSEEAVRPSVSTVELDKYRLEPNRDPLVVVFDLHPVVPSLSSPLAETYGPLLAERLLARRSETARPVTLAAARSDAVDVFPGTFTANDKKPFADWLADRTDRDNSIPLGRSTAELASACSQLVGLLEDAWRVVFVTPLLDDLTADMTVCLAEQTEGVTVIVPDYPPSTRRAGRQLPGNRGARIQSVSDAGASVVGWAPGRSLGALLQAGGQSSP